MDVSSAPRATGTTATRRREETRRRLLSSGTALFAARGLHGVTSHDIAAHAGVAAGTFYLHFADKRALLREIAVEALERLRTRVREAQAGASGPADAVRRRVDELLVFALENREVIRIVFGGDAAEVEGDVIAQLVAETEARLRARMAAGDVTADIDPAVVAQATVGMLARVVAWWAVDPSRAPRETVAATLTRMEVSGTFPPPLGRPGGR